MKKRNEVHQSRRDFLRSLGTYQSLADRYGCHSRQVIENMVRTGFTIKFRKRLIQDALEKGIDIHPELLMPCNTKTKWYATSIGSFFHSLAKKYGGMSELSRVTGIPLSSIRIMCSNKGFLMEKHMPVIEKYARDNFLAVPSKLPSKPENRLTHST